MSDSKQILDPQLENLKKIKHVVVLMLENRSFDNLLGWLYEGETPPRGQAFEGLNWDLWNPLANIDSDGNPFTEKVGVRKNGAEFIINGRKKNAPPVDYTLPTPDPGEGFRDTTHQLYGNYIVDEVFPPTPLAIGFVDNYKNAMLNGTYTFGDAPTDPREIMNCYTPKQTPVLSTLAKKFAVCDQYYCSIPSQTLPNRDFVHAATSTGYVNNDPNNQCDSKTIYNQIQEAIDGGREDLSWAIYSGFSKDKKTDKWAPFSLTRLTMVQIQDKKYDGNFKVTGEFFKDAKAGTLPSYSFLEPQFSGPLQNDQHPPSDIRSGEKLIADVYNAVKSSPQWKETLLIITYDEHGGCYDHSPPTEKAEPPTGEKDGITIPTGQLGFLFQRFGVRVPTVVISPYIEEGTIARPSGWVPFDHTSIIKTVQNCLGLEGCLTNRDKNAPDLSCILTLKNPRRDLPQVKPQACNVEDGNHVNDLHRHSAKILSKLSGDEMPKDDKIHKFNATAYKKYFHTRKRS
jgi:phospholipase C